MNNEMIIISKEFAEANRDYQVGNNKFGFNKTVGDIYFCDPNSLIEFPELFVGVEIIKTIISSTDIYTPLVEDLN